LAAVALAPAAAAAFAIAAVCGSSFCVHVLLNCIPSCLLLFRTAWEFVLQVQ